MPVGPLLYDVCVCVCVRVHAMLRCHSVYGDLVDLVPHPPRLGIIRGWGHFTRSDALFLFFYCSMNPRMFCFGRTGALFAGGATPFVPLRFAIELRGLRPPTSVVAGDDVIIQFGGRLFCIS